MWKNNVQPRRPQMTIQHMCFVCWITKAADKHSEYVILSAFPLQQWLHKCASMLHRTYFSCLVVNYYTHEFQLLNIKSSPVKYYIIYTELQTRRAVIHPAYVLHISSLAIIATYQHHYNCHISVS